MANGKTHAVLKSGDGRTLVGGAALVDGHTDYAAANGVIHLMDEGESLSWQKIPN
jgi:hypothetical protein